MKTKRYMYTCTASATGNKSNLICLGGRGGVQQKTNFEKSTQVEKVIEIKSGQIFYFTYLIMIKSTVSTPNMLSFLPEFIPWI